mmetsp:Transcript_3942/g.11158  ORF Transcript_3942/g.11158 Transcript_3942/m.11158 type:complete len:832 (+) Transcript_3942:182-2677(+)
MADVEQSGCDTSPLLDPPTVAGVLVALVAVCSVITGYVAYRIGFSLAVKRLKAFKTLQKTQPASHQARTATKSRGLFSRGFFRRTMDAASLMGSQQFSDSTFDTAEMGFMSAGEISDQAFNSVGGGSASMSFQRSRDRASQIFGSGKGSGAVSGLFSGNRKKRRAAMQKRRIADERLKEAIKTNNVEDLRTAILAAEKEGASEEMVEAAGIVCDRLVAGFLGFDLRPDELPFHIRKDIPLAQKMGATVYRADPASAEVPGSIPSPKPNEVSTSHEDVKLRGFIQQANAEFDQQESELEIILKKGAAHAEHEDVAWIPVQKSGGGVRYFNYISRNFKDVLPEKLSRDFHYKPEARLRAAEDSIAHLVEEVDSLQAKSEASATQVALLRDELHTSTRQRWYSNHRSRWHNDPATTLQVEWSQVAGIVAKACTEMISEHMNDPSNEIERLDNAVHLAQRVCEKLNTGMGLSAYFAHTGLLQSEKLTYEAGISDGPSKIVGRVLDASKCQLTYLAFTGGETIHVADVKADNRVYLWRGYASSNGSFAVVPIPAPDSGRTLGVLSVDTLHRAPVKALSTVELEALEAVCASLGGLIEKAEAAELKSVLQSISATIEVSGRKLNIEADIMGDVSATEERAAKAIALSCSMQAAENVMRGRRSSASHLEAAVFELNGVEHPSRALVAVCLALLTVIDYSSVLTEMEKREWSVPVDPSELLSLWKGTVLKGMREIASSMLMIFDHLSPADVSVPNCLRFERVEALLKRVPVSAITGDNIPLVVQLLYQWLSAAQEVNDLAVVNRQATITAQQFGEPPPVHRTGQVTAEILCDIICKRFG